MDVELKPCPFCGGQPKVGETNTGVPGMEDCGYAFVECCIVHAHSEESVEDAIEKWNNRHGAGDAEAWRSIESAPRDGTTVIVWFKQHGALSCRWTDRDDDPSSEWAHWHVDDFKHGPFPVRGYSDGDATHWSPLPAPPTDDAARAGDRG